MPNAKGKGFVDYVLWGDDGKPLAVVEAKRTRKRPHRPAAGQALRRLPGDQVRPAAGHLLHQRLRALDLGRRRLSAARGAGFFKKDELELLIQRRTTRKPLADAPINTAIVERYYQHAPSAASARPSRATRAQGAAGDGDRRRQDPHRHRALRSPDALQLGQARAVPGRPRGAGEPGRQRLQDASARRSPVNLVTEKDGEGRVYVSTYPTMMGLIDDSRDGQRRFGVGHFDLIVIDEAHRSVYQKYGAIFDYFDSLAGRADRDAQGRGRPQHLPPVRPGDAACRPTPTVWTRR